MPTTSPAFPAASTPRPEATDPGRDLLTLDSGWAQGRGVYGGLAAAALVRSLERQVGAGRPLRALAVEFLAPALAGPAELRCAAIRDGRSVGVGDAALGSIEGGTPYARATATFARARRAPLAYDAAPAMPAMPPPAEVPRGPDALYAPAFCQHLDLRQTLGPPPFEGGAEARVGGWCRMRGGAEPDVALVVALLDAWPPAAFGRAPGPMGAATVEMRVELSSAAMDDASAGDAALAACAPDAFYAFEAVSDWAGAGYASERATLWSSSGVALATATQLIALFG